MKISPLRTLAFSAAAWLSLIPAPIASAEEDPSRWEWFGSVTPAYIGAAEIDGGGEYESRLVALRLGAAGPLGQGIQGDATLAYSYSDNRFATPTAFGAGAPWGDTERIGLSASVLRVGDGGLVFLVSPSVDYFFEDGADLDDALTFGAVVAASMAFGEGRVLGIGAGVFSQLEEVQVFAFPVVDWAFTERLRLTNPLPAGPTGPAGLELAYRVGDTWALGVGGAYREVGFRLRDDGPVPGGVGEESGFVAFLHAGTQTSRRLSVDLYGGAVIRGRIELQDRNGDALISRDLATAPLVGATLRLAF